MRAVVTGANRGIGLELVRQLLARDDEVDALARDPDASHDLTALASPRLHLHRVDVTRPDDIARLASDLDGVALDVVFNVAGVYGGPRQSLRQMTDDLVLRDVAQTYDINAIGPLRIVLALLPHVRRGFGKKLVHLTSGLGSIGDNTSGGYYAYRMAKAALNMMSRSLAVDLRDEGIISFVINPGWVQTDMGGRNAPTPVADSVRGILRAVDTATAADSGEFLSWKGHRLLW